MLLDPLVQHEVGRGHRGVEIAEPARRELGGEALDGRKVMVDRRVTHTDPAAELAQPERFAGIDQLGRGHEHRLAEVAMMVRGAAARHLSTVTATYAPECDSR